ncbi:MAG: thioredoxin-dependent thiol peroxidase [Gemmatimonadaceae bacterium]
MVEVGTPAPDFTLTADNGKSVTLSQLRGKPVVLYFYPKDDTPGCTTEACEFRDASPQLTALDAIVFGVSPDDVRSHQRFKSKFSLPFDLLVDAEHRVAEAYGVWKEKSMYGRRYMGVERSTFIIDANGFVRTIFAKVKPAGHAVAVRTELERMR